MNPRLGTGLLPLPSPPCTSARTQSQTRLQMHSLRIPTDSDSGLGSPPAPPAAPSLVIAAARAAIMMAGQCRLGVGAPVNFNLTFMYLLCQCEHVHAP
jgi:hypothetical protein